MNCSGPHRLSAGALFAQGAARVAEMLRTLQEQVAELKARKDEDERLKAEEALLMKERFDLDVGEAKAKEKELNSV